MVIGLIGKFVTEHWWLVFPLSWFIFAGWDSFLNYKRTQAKVDLLKSYAKAGKEPPAGLLESLDEQDEDWEKDTGSGQKSGGGNAFLVILFLGLAGVFAYEGYRGWIGIVGGADGSA